MIKLMRKREQLLARCDMQRVELTAVADIWARPLQVIDSGLAGVRYLRRNPLVLAAGLAGLAVVQRRRLWPWVKRGYFVWRSYRTLRDTYLKSVA
jgi:hypothetical protein